MMPVYPVIYWTDFLVFIILFGSLFFVFKARKSEAWARFKKIVENRSLYQIAMVILMFFVLIGFLDTLHFKVASKPHEVKSVLDFILSTYADVSEKTYSKPFATKGFDPIIQVGENNQIEKVYPSLLIAGQSNIAMHLLLGIAIGLVLTFSCYYLVNKIFKISFRIRWPVWITLGILFSVCAWVILFAGQYHILGTDKTGRDVFYLTVKSIRTGLIIGTVTTLVMLPFAISLGMLAGYFRGWVDDVIQYIYTTLSSVPGILLIAAAVLSLQSKIEQDPELRLVILCMILGITSWTSLCRMLRGTTLKLREAEFVEAAVVLGVSKFKILMRHILPNLAHIIIITIVLDFSGLVLAEAVLSYVGVGVAPTSYSWGNLINVSRLEMAREPMVWWSLLGAFSFMFILVFSANLLSDAVQETLDPRRL